MADDSDVRRTIVAIGSHSLAARGTAFWSAAVVCVLIGAIVVGFVLGKRTEMQSVANKNNTQLSTDASPETTGPNDAIDESGIERPSSFAARNKQASQNAPKTSTSSSVPSPFEKSTLVKHKIADAERSVARIQVSKSELVGIGSCFIVAPRMIATNYHVIEGAKDIEITFPGGTRNHSLGWLAIDRTKDLALIECDTDELPPLKLAASRPNKLDDVYAIGSPRGFADTVSMGIVSAIRPWPELGENATVIQTTAAISNGNSGGPLLNEQAEVVGITYAFNTHGQNLNFAIAIEHLVAMMKSAQKEAKSFTDLPAPRRDRIQDGPPKSGAPNWIAKQQQAKSDAENKLFEFAKTEAELNRIVARAGQLTQQIATIEVEGTALTMQRDRIWADMQSAAYGANATYSAAKAAAWQEYQQRTGNAGSATLTADANTAMGRAVSLQQQYDGICQQINATAQQRDALVIELNALRRKYDELHTDTPAPAFPRIGPELNQQKATTDRVAHPPTDTRTKALTERYKMLTQYQDWITASGKSIIAKYVSHDAELKHIRLAVPKGSGKDRVVQEYDIEVEKLSKLCQSRLKQIDTIQKRLDELTAKEAN